MITSLRLQHFRSYQDSSFEFGDGVNIIVGPNGSGKTNLLEALQVLAIGSSYRVDDAELMKFDEEWARLDGVFAEGAMTRVYKYISYPRPMKTYELDGKTYRRLGVNNMLPHVLFEPNHLQLLHGAPELRRSYLDSILERTMPGYAVIRRNYRRILSQRNALLKRGRVTEREMFPWNLRLGELGAAVSAARSNLVMELAPLLAGLYRELSGSSVAEVTLDYLQQFPADNYETSLLHKLESSLDREMLRGFTAYGPHREDMAVNIGGHPAAETASRGETRTIILGLKLLELDLIEQVAGKSAMFLLDDVFSELDGARRRALTTHLSQRQAFLTTTDADIVVKHFTDSTIIPLS